MGLIPKSTKTLLLASLVLFTACGPKGSNQLQNQNLNSALQEQTVLEDDPTSEQEAALTDAPSEVSSKAEAVAKMTEPKLTDKQRATVLKKYDFLDPKHLVPDALLEKAVLFYDANLSNVTNKNYLGVYDYSLKSTKNRFFIVNMKTGAVLALHSSHGSGSDPKKTGYASIFSNTSGSNASSLGYAKTGETYIGKHGLSLRMDGLSSTNSNIRARAVVVHGADYVQDSDVVQGRSWGCPAVSMKNRDQVIKLLKGGAIIYFGFAK